MVSLDEIKLKLPERYRHGKNLESLLNSYISQLQFEETQINNLKLDLQIDTAKGVYLELIGRLLQVGRQSNESDSDYRSRIKTYISTVSIKTTENAFVKVLEESFGLSSDNYTISESANKITIRVELDGVSSEEDSLKENLDAIKGAGKYIILEISLSQGDFQENLELSERLDVVDSSDDGYFKCGLSVCGDTLVPPCGDYYAGYFLLDYSRLDGDDLVL